MNNICIFGKDNRSNIDRAASRTCYAVVEHTRIMLYFISLWLDDSPVGGSTNPPA